MNTLSSKRTWRSAALPLALFGTTLCSPVPIGSSTEAAEDYRCDIPDQGLPPSSDDSFTVASINIKGLPDFLLQKDDLFEPNRRSCLGEFSKQFNFVSGQEGFYQTKTVIRAAGKAHVWHENFKSGFIKDSGLFTLSDYPLRDKQMTAFNSCKGYFDNAGDCFARKGVTSATIDFPNGSCVRIINTHLDAGQGSENEAVRLRQLKVVEAAIPDECSVILTGDFNFKDEGLAHLGAFLERNGFQYAARSTPDMIAYRGNIHPVRSQTHNIKGRYTDHEAISVEFAFN